MFSRHHSASGLSHASFAEPAQPFAGGASLMTAGQRPPSELQAASRAKHNSLNHNSKLQFGVYYRIVLQFNAC